MINPIFSYHDKYASYQLGIENRIICAFVKGAVGNGLSKHYNQHFCLLVDRLGDGSWGHFGDFSQCEGLTPEATEVAVQLNQYSKQQGCAASAFQINSALLANQIKHIHKKSGMPKPIQYQIFNTKQACIDFIESHLS